MRVTDYFDKGVELNRSADFVVSADSGFTYAEAQDLSYRISAGLHGRGFRAGDGIGVLSPNDPLVLVAMLGLWRAGGAWTPLNMANALEATIDFLVLTRTKWLFYHSTQRGVVDTILESVPSVQHAICLDANIGGDSLESLIAGYAPADAPDLGDPLGACDSLVGILPTGGTTGRSKAVLLTNQCLATMIESGVQYYPPTEHPVNLVVAPLTHGAAMGALTLATVGAKIVVRPKFDATDVLETIEREAVTHMYLPPTAFYALLDHPQSRTRDLSSLRMLLITAAPVAPEKLRQGVETFGPCMCCEWGQTEAPMILTWLDAKTVAAAAAGHHPERLASCGRATLQSNVAVMDEQGKLLPIGEQGELVARGRLISPGYFEDEAATTKARQYGWHHTGDIGYRDAGGYFYIVDRKSDMIISGGFNVYPAEVEAALLAQRDILECAVIGVPDDKWGEMVIAIVVPTAGAQLDADQIIASAKTALGSVKAPKKVTFAEALPKTPVGKVDKKVIRAEYWAGRETAIR